MALSKETILEDRYQIERLLAQGGMGAVYRCFDLKLKTTVAIKENFFQLPEGIHQFEQEAFILAGLRHSGLPRVTDHFHADGKQYLVMDYIEGDNLWEIVQRKRGPLVEAQALNYMIQVCNAVSYLHRRNPPILHRDIKPKNIKITPNGEAVLVDFGISRIALDQKSTQSGARALTPGFSPPEQYSKTGTTPASDIYALGATLYAILTGQEPPDSISLLVDQVDYKPPGDINAAISPAVSDAIEHAMQVKVSDRPKTVAAWRDELIVCFPRHTEFLPQMEPDPPLSVFPGPDVTTRDNTRLPPDTKPLEPEEAPPSPQTEAITGNRPARPRRYLWLALTLVILVVGIGAAIWWTGRGNSTPSASSAGITPTPDFAATTLETAQAATIEADAGATVQAATVAAEATQQLVAQSALTAQALDVIRVEAERTAQAQAAIVATAAAISTAAVETEFTATANAIATAAADVQATGNAVATTAAGFDTTATAQAQATETGQAALAETPAATATPIVEALAQPTPTAIPLPTATPAPAISGKLAFSLVQGTGYKVYVIEVQPTAPTKLFADIANARNPALSPDGRYLLVDSTGGEYNAIIRLTSSGFEPTVVTCHSITTESGRPSWSPDGIFLVFDGLGADPSNPQAYIHATDRPECDLELFRFTIGGGAAIDNNGLNPLWGPDYRIYFRSCATWILKRSDCGIWSADPNGNDLLKLHDNPNQLQTDVGQNRLMMMSTETGDWEVYALSLPEGQVTNLTNNPSADVWGTLSPDGRTIAYLSNRGGRWAIWLMDADGGAPREWLIINPDWGEVDPNRFTLERMSWSP